MSFARFSMALLAMLALTACTTYYEITDPTTDKKYYTTDIDKNDDGSITIDAEGTGAQVTIQNSEVREVTADQYEAAVGSN